MLDIQGGEGVRRLLFLDLDMKGLEWQVDELI